MKVKQAPRTPSKEKHPKVWRVLGLLFEKVGEQEGAPLIQRSKHTIAKIASASGC